MRIDIGSLWPRDKARSPPVAESALSDISPVHGDINGAHHRSHRTSNKKGSWLSSLARNKSVKRTSQRLQGWLSTDNLFSSQTERSKHMPLTPKTSLDAGDYGFLEYYNQTNCRTESYPFRDEFFDPVKADVETFASAHRNKRSSYACTAEFYPGALSQSSLSYDAQGHRCFNSNQNPNIGRVRPRYQPNKRSQSFLSQSKNVRSIDMFGSIRGESFTRQSHVHPERYLPAVQRHTQEQRATPKRSKNLYRSMSMSGHLNETRSPAFHRNTNIRRSRSRDGLTLLGSTEESDRVVFHYPPNGCFKTAVVLVPRLSPPQDGGNSNFTFIDGENHRTGDQQLQNRKSQSLDTLLEEHYDPSPSPLPLPALSPLETRADVSFPFYDVPRNNSQAYYLLDDFLSPVDKPRKNTDLPRKPSEPFRTSSEQIGVPEPENEACRPQVASFSSSSPESADEQIRRFQRSSSPLYSTLDDATTDIATTVANTEPRNNDFPLHLPAGVRLKGSEAPADAVSPAGFGVVPTEFPPFVAPDWPHYDRVTAVGDAQRCREVDRIRAAYQTRFEQASRFPRYLRPCFVPATSTTTPRCSWHENNPLPPSTSRRHPQLWPASDVSSALCSCHGCYTRRARHRHDEQRRLPAPRSQITRRRSFADHYHRPAFQSEQQLHGTCGVSQHVQTNRAFSQRNGFVVSRVLRLPVQPGTGSPANNGGGTSRNKTQSSATIPPAANTRKPEQKTYVNNQPISPTDAVRHYGSYLTNYELSEIEHYDQVWFVGAEADKVQGPETVRMNDGFDDEHGNYIKVAHDHLAYRYEVLEVIGRGSFGQVIRALDHKTNTHVAIKIIRNKKRFHQQALTEVKILDHLRKRDKDGLYNIIHMLDYFYFRNHLCVSFQLMGLNLFELIKKNNYQGLSMPVIRKFASSLVQCLRLLFKEGIIHCDLKPENVLLKGNNSTSIRIIDFGSSCYTHQRVYTYIQSRFYRSPEVILGLPYGSPIDMWSLGCILAELHTGFPLFPGENEVEQLACIMEVLDLPPDELISHASRRRLFFDSRGNPRTITNTKGRRRRPGSRSLASILNTSDATFIDIVERCLTWDPFRRLTPEVAARHPFLAWRPASLPHGAPISPIPAPRHQHISSAPYTHISGAPYTHNSGAPYTHISSAPYTHNNHGRRPVHQVASAAESTTLAPPTRTESEPLGKGGGKLVSSESQTDQPSRLTAGPSDDVSSPPTSDEIIPAEEQKSQP